MALIAIVGLPVLAAFLCWLPPIRKAAWVVTAIFSIAEFLLALLISSEVIANGRVSGVFGWLEADGLSALMLAMISFVCAVAAIYSGGYMQHGDHKDRLWWFYCNYNLFVFSLVVVPSLAEVNLVWVGVELVTLFAVLLVSFENTRGALEAAWKFSVLTIMGAPIALLGFLVLFWAYHSIGLGGLETWGGLTAHAQTMPPELLKLSFLLVFVGFGSKTGLAPMHTWLPDAHSQAPTPVCAVLSAVKTSVPLYVILRFLGILLVSPSARLGQWMIVIGLISVAIAAFLLLQVHDYKRMFAYSTVEHMGIVLTAAGFATQSSDFGAVSQLLNHAITKSLCFYVAGIVLLAMGTRDIKSVRGLLRVSPFAGAALIFSALAIAGAPPFPIFLSEFSILSAGIRGGHPAAVAILASLIVIAFIGIMLQVNRMAFGRPEVPQAPVEIPATCRFAVVVAALPVAVLGIYIPASVHRLLQLAAQQLGGH
ncbi:MAG TPA: proton-conducting transporter membrane subunit [Candidatus Solibacter sp.]|nr:proton-conducting transporter membrane subunit [Candidatus Solibacter sp.]